MSTDHDTRLTDVLSSAAPIVELVGVAREAIVAGAAVGAATARLRQNLARAIADRAVREASRVLGDRLLPGHIRVERAMAILTADTNRLDDLRRRWDDRDRIAALAAEHSDSPGCPPDAADPAPG